MGKSDFLLVQKNCKMNKTENINPLEAVSKCSILFEIKEGENFNHRNTWSISRIKI